MQIAHAFGLEGVKIETKAELNYSLQSAFESDKTTLLDVKVDKNEILRVVQQLGHTRSMH